ncbi:hypothetical protein BS78_06G254200 [Paspalum vaginatum]|nr:hypothetical protein BS78_06G254200 [Paspalum vaginatum]
MCSGLRSLPSGPVWPAYGDSAASLLCCLPRLEWAPDALHAPRTAGPQRVKTRLPRPRPSASADGRRKAAWALKARGPDGRARPASQPVTAVRPRGLGRRKREAISCRPWYTGGSVPWPPRVVLVPGGVVVDRRPGPGQLQTDRRVLDASARERAVRPKEGYPNNVCALQLQITKIEIQKVGWVFL